MILRERDFPARREGAGVLKQRHPSPSPQLSPPRAAWKMQVLGTEQFRLRLWDGPQLCSWACNALPAPPLRWVGAPPSAPFPYLLTEGRVQPLSVNWAGGLRKARWECRSPCPWGRTDQVDPEHMSGCFQGPGLRWPRVPLWLWGEEQAPPTSAPPPEAQRGAEGKGWAEGLSSTSLPPSRARGWTRKLPSRDNRWSGGLSGCGRVGRPVRNPS